MQNAGRLWYHLSALDRRQRLQRALFPDGLIYDQTEKFGTAASRWPVKEMKEIAASGNQVAPPTGFEPVLPG